MPGILRNRVGYIVYISLWGRTSSITRKLHVDQYLDALESFVGGKIDVHSDAN